MTYYCYGLTFIRCCRLCWGSCAFVYMPWCVPQVHDWPSRGLIFWIVGFWSALRMAVWVCQACVCISRCKFRDLKCKFSVCRFWRAVRYVHTLSLFLLRGQTLGTRSRRLVCGSSRWVSGFPPEDVGSCVGCWASGARMVRLRWFCFVVYTSCDLTVMSRAWLMVPGRAWRF